MKTSLWIYLNAVIVLALTFGLVGCGRHGKNDAEKHIDVASEVVSYSPKSGVRVPAKIAKLIDLKIADVEERKIEGVFQFTAAVYKTTEEALHVKEAHASAFASGFVGSKDAALLKEGQTAFITVGERVVSARILSVNSSTQRGGGQVEILLSIADEKNELSQGQFVSVSVPIDGQISGTSVPRSAMLHTIEGDFVYAVSGEHFVRTPVKTGTMSEDFIEISDGLYVGDQVVVKPVMTLWLAELQVIRGGKACADGH